MIENLPGHHTVFLSGFGPKGGKTAICNLVGVQHANLPVPRGGESEPRGANAPPPPPLKETLRHRFPSAECQFQC